MFFGKFDIRGDVFLQDTARDPGLADIAPFCLARVGNHSARFGSSSHIKLLLFCYCFFKDENVLIVIAGDNKYKDKEEEEQHFLSRWARESATCRQFRSELKDGRRSFIFSWNKKHGPVHEDALLHFFDPSKKGRKFKYQPKPEPVASSEEPGMTLPSAIDIQKEVRLRLLLTGNSSRK